MARLWAEACSARHLVPARHSVRAWRPVRQASLKVARHALTAVAAYPDSEERVAEREAVAPLRAEHPEATVSLQQVAVFLQVAGARALSLVRSAAEFGREASRSAAARTSVVEAAAPAEELDAVAAEVRPQVVAHAAGPRPAAQYAAVAGEAAGVLADAAVPPPEAGAELDEAVPLLAAAQIEAGEEEAALRRVALGEVAARRGAVAWVFRPDRLLLWPGP